MSKKRLALSVSTQVQMTAEQLDATVEAIERLERVCDEFASIVDLIGRHDLHKLPGFEGSLGAFLSCHKVTQRLKHDFPVHVTFAVQP